MKKYLLKILAILVVISGIIFGIAEYFVLNDNDGGFEKEPLPGFEVGPSGPPHVDAPTTPPPK